MSRVPAPVGVPENTLVLELKLIPLPVPDAEYPSGASPPVPAGAVNEKAVPTVADLFPISGQEGFLSTIIGGTYRFTVTETVTVSAL